MVSLFANKVVADNRADSSQVQRKIFGLFADHVSPLIDAREGGTSRATPVRASRILKGPKNHEWDADETAYEPRAHARETGRLTECNA